MRRTARTMVISRQFIPCQRHHNTSSYRFVHSSSSSSSFSSHDSQQGILYHEWISTVPSRSSSSSSLESSSSSDNNNNNSTNETMVFLHGLLGNGNNLKTLGRKVVGLSMTPTSSKTTTPTTTTPPPTTRGLLVDQRGHGRSLNMIGTNNKNHEPPHTFDACVDDLHKTLRIATATTSSSSNHTSTENTSSSSTVTSTLSLMMGHSWGGRIALQYLHSLLQKENEEEDDDDSIGSSLLLLPRQVWLLDTVPGQAHESVYRVLDAIQSIPTTDLNLTRTTNTTTTTSTGETKKDPKKVVISKLLEKGLDVSIATWLASSLRPRPFQDEGEEEEEGQQWEWGFDVNVVQQLLPEFQQQDFIGILLEILTLSSSSAAAAETTTTTATTATEIHLVRGESNMAWEDNPRTVQQLYELQQEYSHQFQFHTLPRAGHWLHVDNLPGLLDIVVMKQQGKCV